MLVSGLYGTIGWCEPFVWMIFFFFLNPYVCTMIFFLKKANQNRISAIKPCIADSPNRNAPHFQFVSSITSVRAYDPRRALHH